LTQSHFGGGGTWPTLLEGDGQPRFLAVILSTGALFDEVLSQAPRRSSRRWSVSLASAG